MNTFGISVGSVLLVLLMMAFSLLVLSVTLCRARAKQQGKSKIPARLDQDQLYEEVNICRDCPADVDTQPNISYATHHKI